MLEPGPGITRGDLGDHDRAPHVELADHAVAGGVAYGRGPWQPSELATADHPRSLGAVVVADDHVAVGIGE